MGMGKACLALFVIQFYTIDLCDKSAVFCGKIRQSSDFPLLHVFGGLSSRNKIDTTNSSRLRLSVEAPDAYVLEKDNPLRIVVRVENINRESRLMDFQMNIPDGVAIDKVYDEKTSEILTCQLMKIFKCDLGGSLEAEAVNLFKIILYPAVSKKTISKLDFVIRVNYTTIRDGTGISHASMLAKTVHLIVDTKLAVSRHVRYGKEVYTVSDYVPLSKAVHEDQIGPQAVYFYEIRNDGMAPVESITLTVPWREISISYLMQQPETSNNVHCKSTDKVNKYNVQLNRTLSEKSYLKSEFGISVEYPKDQWRDRGEIVGGNQTLSAGASVCTITKLEPKDSAWIALRMRVTVFHVRPSVSWSDFIYFP